MKKRKLVGAIVLGALVFPPLAQAQFGIGEIAYLIKLWEQAKELYSLEQQAQRTAQNAAAFVQHPNWKQRLEEAGLSTEAAIRQQSNGADPVSVKSVDDALAEAEEAMREAQAAAQVSGANAGIYSVLQLQAAQAKIERDRIADQIKFYQDVDTAAQGGIGLSNVSRSIQNWRMQ